MWYPVPRIPYGPRTSGLETCGNCCFHTVPSLCKRPFAFPPGPGSLDRGHSQNRRAWVCPQRTHRAWEQGRRAGQHIQHQSDIWSGRNSHLLTRGGQRQIAYRCSENPSEMYFVLETLLVLRQTPGSWYTCTQGTRACRGRLQSAPGHAHLARCSLYPHAVVLDPAGILTLLIIERSRARAGRAAPGSPPARARARAAAPRG